MATSGQGAHRGSALYAPEFRLACVYTGSFDRHSLTPAPHSSSSRVSARRRRPMRLATPVHSRALTKGVAASILCREQTFTQALLSNEQRIDG